MADIAEGKTHKAAGILFVTKEGKALFLKRGPGGDQPGAWCFPGGTTEGDETAEQTALREAAEELGSYPQGPLAYHTRSIQSVVSATPQAGIVSDQVDFTTFLQRAEEEFAPKLNGEHTGYAWAPVNDPPQPLHPGCNVALGRLFWNELDVARAMAAGQLTSPQQYMNMHLFDLRITGTSFAFRNEKKGKDGTVLQKEEYVYRRPENYLTDDFVARCGGLQVIVLHPPGNSLTSKEFIKRTVGAMMFAYIKGDEVWGIAKIYDDETNEWLKTNTMSTSPGVILGGGEFKMKAEDGTDILVEGDPVLLDHLAICSAGVWDKGGEPSGVRMDSQNNNGESEMALSDDDLKTVEARIAAQFAAQSPVLAKTIADAIRNDDAGPQSKMLTAMDAVLKRMDSVVGRMDEMDKKMDAEEDEEKAKKDSAKFTSRGDSESDDDYGKRMDAMCETVKKDAMAEGADEETAKKRADRARKDAMEEHKKADKARKDAAEDEEKKKADAAANAASQETRDRLAALERTMKPRSVEDRALFGKTQARADDVFLAYGKQAPGSMAGEEIMDYRVRLLTMLQPHSRTFKDAKLTAVADSVTFDHMEETILREAAAAARNPVDLQAGQLREVIRNDSRTGLRATEFYGPTSFIHTMKRPSNFVRFKPDQVQAGAKAH